MQLVCLSVKNPISYQIFGGKDVENRSWKTDYRGRLYIHSSGYPFAAVPGKLWPKEIEGTEYDKLADQFSVRWIEHYERLGIDVRDGAPKNEALWFCRSQAIIGHVELTDIIRDSKSPYAERDQYHWVFKNPVLLDKPLIGIKGKLMIWRYEYGQDLL